MNYLSKGLIWYVEAIFLTMIMKLCNFAHFFLINVSLFNSKYLFLNYCADKYKSINIFNCNILQRGDRKCQKYN